MNGAANNPMDSSRVQSPKPIRRRIVWLLGLVAIVGCGAALIGFTVAQSGKGSMRLYRLGAAQILEGPDEVWIFAQVDNVTTRPERIASPGTVREVAFQMLIRMNHKGVVEERRFRSVSPLNWRIGPVFRFHGRFYLWRDPTAEKRSLFEWDGKEFTRVSAESSAEILNSIDPNGQSAAQIYERLNELSRENGFRRIAAVTQHDLALDVVSTQHSIRVYTDGDPLARGGQNLVAASTSHASPWTHTLIDVRKINDGR